MYNLYKILEFGCSDSVEFKKYVPNLLVQNCAQN